jgi:dihydrodipicolinate synthase/N-acetylneuraminate lyase
LLDADPKPRLRGALAASVTPLTDGGAALDEDAVGPLVDFYADSGLDGILALGTTGEGILLSVRERRRAASLFCEAADGRLAVSVHCGAQTTADTLSLAVHAAAAGAAAVTVIGPPYFPLDDRALLAHFAAAAAACAPTPFYVYEFAARSGYAVPPTVLAELGERAPNLAGLKVSDTPWGRFEPYLLDGLDVLVGPEALIHRGLERGAVGAISALAAGFPCLVSEVVRTPSAEGAERLGAVRTTVQRFPMPAALKLVLRRRGVAVRPDVRAPLRILDEAEERGLWAALDEVVGEISRAPGGN